MRVVICFIYIFNYRVLNRDLLDKVFDNIARREGNKRMGQVALFFQKLIYFPVAICLGARNAAMHRINLLSEGKSILPEMFLIIAIGLIFYGVSYALYYASCDKVGSSLAMVLFYLYPMFVSLFSWFFDRAQLSKLAVVSFVMIVGGSSAIVFTNDLIVAISGILYGLLACILYSTYVYIAKLRVKTIDPRFATFVLSFSNALVYLLISMTDGSIVIPKAINDIYQIGAVGLIWTTLPFLLFIESFSFENSPKFSVLSLSEPIITLIVGATALGASISLIESAGIITLVLGALCIQFERGKNW